jgi:hypothetical protein
MKLRLINFWENKLQEKHRVAIVFAVVLLDMLFLIKV